MMIVVQSEDGQGLVEYALILILIAVAIVIALTFLGGELSDLFSRVAEAFNV